MPLRSNHCAHENLLQGVSPCVHDWWSRLSCSNADCWLPGNICDTKHCTWKVYMVDLAVSLYWARALVWPYAKLCCDCQCSLFLNKKYTNMKSWPLELVKSSWTCIILLMRVLDEFQVVNCTVYSVFFLINETLDCILCFHCHCVLLLGSSMR